MPRQARKRSNTQIYHVMLRGINQQQIFEDNEDYAKFIQVIRDCKSLSGFQLFAYCLMGNHIHLLLKETNEPIEQIFRRIGSRYVYWYNVKYRRVGHLFQDRFKSEPIETNEYFLTVLRYIHQNPSILYCWKARNKITKKKFSSKQIKQYLKQTKKLKSALGIGTSGKTARRMWYMDCGITTALSNGLNPVVDFIKEFLKKVMS